MKWFLVIVGMLFSVALFAGNKVGNGDDGADLEGAVPILDGPLVETRKTAVALLKKLNVDGIPGLGKLIPEVERTNLYLAQMDVPGEVSDGPASPEGLVYARTMPEEHAPTRFFPVALKLSQAQMVSLHVHEALHRSLPPSVREDEGVVTRLTLAMTGPEGNHDTVALIANDLIPIAQLAQKEEEHFQQPSNVGYAFRQFFSGGTTSTYPINHMHLIHSDLYPFGGTNQPIGFGIEASLVSRPGYTQTGPLGISAKTKLWSVRGFDIGVFGSVSLNALSSEELKNSPFGRDIFTLGISMKKDLKRFYIENFLSYTFEGKSQRTMGKVDYHYSYGGVTTAKVRGGARLGAWDLGAFLELNLAEHFRVSGGAFNTDFGRYRIFAMGPEFTYRMDDFSFGLSGRFLVDSTRGANFDYLGDLMGPGVAQGGLQFTASVLF